MFVGWQEDRDWAVMVDWAVVESVVEAVAVAVAPAIDGQGNNHYHWLCQHYSCTFYLLL